MTRSIILFITFCLISGITNAQTNLSNVTVKWKKNGVWISNTYNPNAIATITPDHGSTVNVTITRTANAPVPSEFTVADWNNGATHTQTSSSTSVTFTNCAGSLNTQLWAMVNTVEGSVRINVEWSQAAKPDLTISQLTVNASANPAGKVFQVGERVTVSSIVWNVGGLQAGESQLAYFIKTTADNTSGNPFITSQVPTIPAGKGSNQQSYYTFTSNDLGTRYFVLEADHSGQVNEASESNNIRSFGPFQVVAPPSLSLSPTVQDYGTIEVNSCSDEKTFQLVNDGGTAISGHIALFNSEHFTITSGGGDFTLNPGQTRNINVKFCPKSAGSKSINLRIYVNGLSSHYTQATVSGNGFTPPESIVGISPEFTLDTRGPSVNSGGIFLKVVETAGTDKVKKVGYKYSYTIEMEESDDIEGNRKSIEEHELPMKVPLGQDGFAFLEPPVFPDKAYNKNDFLNEILLFDENDNQIGHIAFSYSFEWEGMNTRHAVIFLHNDDEICKHPDGPPHYFPYTINNPNNVRGIRYNYYKDGEYPVSMLIPPHFNKEEDESNTEGYRFPLSYDHAQPVVFVHGLTGTFSYQSKFGADPENTRIKGDQVSYWYHTERMVNQMYDNNERRMYHAWQFYYPNEDDLRHCGMTLRQAINYLYPFYKDHGKKIGLVAHSMGGLVTLEFLTTNTVEYNQSRIQKVLLSMAPNHGSLAANRVYFGDEGSFEIGHLLGTALEFDILAPCYRDLSIGSNFLYELHKKRDWLALLDFNNTGSLKDNVFVIAGLTDKDYRKEDIQKLKLAWLVKINDIHTEALNHDDGIVSISSTSLLDKGIGLAGIFGNHDDGKFGTDGRYSTHTPVHFMPNLVTAYFQSVNFSEFEDYCINEEPVIELFIDHEKIVKKPVGQSLESLKIGRRNLDLQKGAVTPIIKDESSLLLHLYENKGAEVKYVLSPEKIKGNTHIGRFNKNASFSRVNSHGSYYFTKTKYPPLLVRSYFYFLIDWWADGGFEFLDGTYPLIFNNPSGIPRHLGFVNPNIVQHTFLELPDNINYLKKSINKKSSPHDFQLTPTKQFYQVHSNEEVYASIYVDDQTQLALFNLYSDDLSYPKVDYSVSLSTPDGSFLDLSDPDIEHYKDTYTGLNVIAVNNPAPGKWQMYPKIDSSHNFDKIGFITLAELVSEIKAESLIDKYQHITNSPAILSGSIKAPDIGLFKSDIIESHLIIRHELYNIDTLLLDQIAIKDTAIIFSNSFTPDSSGIYHYTLIIEGVYNGYRFERAVYGDFLVQDQAPVFRIPDQYMNITNRSVDLIIPQYLFCSYCHPDSMIYEVSLISTEFEEEDLLYFFLPENNVLRLSINTDAPLAEARFSIDAYLSDSLVAGTSFRVNYTSPGVPDHLQVSEIGFNSARLSWISRGLENKWDVLYGYSGFNPADEGELLQGITDISYVLKDMVQGEPYDFYVRAVYEGEDNYSVWSWPYTFTTNYSITATIGANGSIKPEGVSGVQPGGHFSVQIIPDEGYHIHDVLVNGESVGAVSEYVFMNVSGNQSIHAEFLISLYNISFVVKEAGTGNEIAGAMITFNGHQHDAGIYLFDNLAPGTYNYLVQMPGYMNMEGSVSITSEDKVVTIYMESGVTQLDDVGFPGLKIYPNPAQNTLWIEFMNNSHGKTSVLFYNMYGQVMKSLTITEKDLVKLEFDLKGISPGSYVLQISNDRSLSVHRIIIMP